MPLRLLNLQFPVRANCVQILFGDIVLLQVLFVEHQAVTVLTRMLLNIIRYKIQRTLLAVAINNFPESRYAYQIVSGSHGHMDMAVDNTGHDEFPAKIRDLSLVRRKTGLVTHINEFSILHREGGCCRFALVRCEDSGVFYNLIRFHWCSSFM